MNYESQSESYDAAIAAAEEQGAARFNGLLRALAALLVPQILSHPDMVKALAFDSSLVEGVVQAEMDEVLKQVNDARVVDITRLSQAIASLETRMENRIDEKIDTLTQLDKAAIHELIESHLEDCHNLVTTDELDDRLSEYVESTELDDKVMEVLRGTTVRLEVDY